MEQFSLEKWLQNKSRKVVTRRGNPVRIICTDRKHGEDELPVVFLEEIKGGEMLLTCKSDGRSDNNYDTQYDLFFADEEEKLTEFERRIYQLINYTDVDNFPSIQEVKEEAEILLDLARKELMSEISDFEIYDKGFKEGKKYALKDLPKWRYINQIQAKNHYAHIANGIISPSGYFISYDDLETLPKEE